MLKFDQIVFDSEVMGGRACIRGMRISGPHPQLPAVLPGYRQGQGGRVPGGSSGPGALVG